jgi:hypothetical protein
MVPLVLALHLALAPAQSSTACADVADCREHALSAAAAGDYESFHDYAWRALQKGKPNDPDLMYLLARAQSLSGRPGDALVMLQRIADLGVVTDAATNDDFRRVRSLKDWPALEAKLGTMASRTAPAPASPAPPSASPKPEPGDRAKEPAAGGRAPAKKPAPAKKDAPRAEAEPRTEPAAAAPPAEAPAEAEAAAGEEALTFDAPALDPAGLAYDAVSRRFVVGDKRAARLVIVDEVSHHLVNLASAASAGFYDTITSLAIDARRGDLWVTSVKGSPPESALHKLQLVSGRVLLGVPVPPELGAVRLVDVGVLPDGTVLALDAEGGRVLRVASNGRTCEVAAEVPSKALAGMAVGDGLVYVSDSTGITRVDLSSRESRPVQHASRIALDGISSLRASNGSLVAVQQVGGGKLALVRLRLDATGRRVTRRDLLAPSLESAATAIAGNHVFYLTSGQGTTSTTVRRVRTR